jgi:hypothetical protein
MPGPAIKDPISSIIEEGKALLSQASAKPVMPSITIPSKSSSGSGGLTAWTVMSIYPEGRGGAGGRIGRSGSSGGGGINWVLPLPLDLADQNTMSYEPASFNSLQRAVATGAANVDVGKIGSALSDLAGGNVIDAAVGGYDVLKNAVTSMGPQLEGAYNDLKSGKGGGMAYDLIGQMAPEGVSNVLLGTKGLYSNPNMEALFKGANLRTWSFSWNLTPLKPADSQQIVAFIQEVKKLIYPSYDTGSRGGIFSLQKFPAEFVLSFNSSGAKGGAKRIFSTATCACTDMTVNFTPQGGFFTHEDGRATNISINMTFQEVYTLDQSDIPSLTIE